MSKKRVIASIEARMGSSRLSGKVLADVCGQPAIGRLVNRLKKAKLVDDIVLATTTSATDEPLVAWAKKEGVHYFRGSEEDVLNRVVKAQEKMESDIVVEVTGDCTLLDPEIIDWGVETFLNNKVDVVTNTWKNTFPQGIDVQVFPLKLLQDVEKKIKDPAVREHVSLYFYEHPEIYNILNLVAPPRWSQGSLRFQLDYPEDLEFIRAVYSHLEKGPQSHFGLEEILNLLRQRPEITKINAHCVEKELR